MKILFASAIVMCCCCGCFQNTEVDFVYFNLSTNEIFVNSVSGLPIWASPGVLVPVHAEDRLSEASATSWEGVAIASTLKIVWSEKGASRHAEFRRDELGIPARLKNAQLRFSYLGNDQWRVKLINQGTK